MIDEDLKNKLKFTRNYKFKSDISSSRGSYWIAIIISAIAFLLLWYLL
jgi:hypothetical protein